MNLTCFILLIVAYLSSFSIQEKILKNVIIFSRHNLRVPLSETLEEITPKPWPKWNKKSTHLTNKGEILEGFMGEYFGAWLRKQQVLPERCPNKNEFFSYANILQRTRVSAQAFIDKAFPNCNLTVFISAEYPDPIFYPKVNNHTETFKKQAIKEMNEKLVKAQSSLNYKFLEELLNYKLSKKCQQEYFCDLKNDNNTEFVEYGNMVDINGPLKIAYHAAEAILLEYYEGIEVAWGQSLTEHQWKDLLSFVISYHDVKDNTTLVANDISQASIKYMKSIWKSGDNNKVTLLTAHDTNIIALLLALNFKTFVLPKQMELIPIGGRIVFQKWFDKDTNENYLKVVYVYQSTEQLREAKRLSFDEPPQWFLLEMNDCKTDYNGYCKWSDFDKILDRY